MNQEPTLNSEHGSAAVVNKELNLPLNTLTV